MKTKHLLSALTIAVISTPMHAAESYWRYGLSQDHHNGNDGSFTAPPGVAADVKNVALDKGTQLNIAVGTSLGKRLRVEAELAHSFATRVGSNGDLVSVAATAPVSLEGEVTRTALFANAIFDLGDSAQPGLTPFATIGLGMSQNTISELTLIATPNHINFDDSDTMELAWKAGLGATWRTANNVLIDFSANYFDAGEAETDKTVFSSALGSLSELEKPFAVDITGMNYGISVRVPF